MYYFLLFFISSLIAQPIDLYVKTKENVSSLYAPAFESQDPTVTDYVAQLREICLFDFSQHGSYIVAHQTAQLRLEGSYHAKILKLTLTHGQEQFSVDILLSLHLAQDRRSCHKGCDTLISACLKRKSIATLKILYTKTYHLNQGDYSEVWEADYDGGNARCVSSKDILCTTPLYLPPIKGKPSHYLYISYLSGQSKLVVSSLNKKTQTSISELKGNYFTPAIRKNMIVFANDSTGNPELYLQRFSTTTYELSKPELIQAYPHGAQACPTISPDQTQIAFTSNKDGYPRIYILNLATKKEKLLTKQSRDSSTPSWSLDGKKIAYSALTDDVRQIWIYDIASDTHTQVTYGALHKENPQWAPDSIHILYNTAVSPCELFLLDTQQNTTVQLTQGSEDKRFPSWEPFSS